MRNSLIITGIILLLTTCSTAPEYDVILMGGTIYNGSGEDPFIADIGITGNSISFIGDLSKAKAKTQHDVSGLAVSPGFINMLSWATESLIIDGNAQSDIRQGVTLEVMGEGFSMGPLNDQMKEEMRKDVKRSGLDHEIGWTTLGEYLEFLERSGSAVNVASFVGATTLRIHEMGYANRPPTPEELERMEALARQAMEEGALGIGSSLIYAPASYSSTEELIALCKAASAYKGMYITHMRSEGDNIFSAVNETIRIAREANIPAEIYHLKFAGQRNWNKIDSVINMIEAARREGLRITTDMYTYTAGATGLDASMPTWLQEGGINQWIARMKDPKTRSKALREMREPSEAWENLLLLAGNPDNVLLVGFSNDSLKRFTGMTLKQVADIHKKSAEETAMDLVCADSTRVGTVYFLMKEENVKRQIALPYMSFGSDAEAPATEGHFLKYNPHPRAYGNFSRLIGKYVREEKVITLQEAIRKLTLLPATNLKIEKRGLLQPGYFADIAIFDPAKVQDHATFEKPHQYSTGMVHVFVNGVQVLNDGEHTGAKPGRVVRGPGWQGKQKSF
ncbi:MAG: D-aminoacylase [Cyclobacteriaceae bacterium]|nr:D-aminoacylase [Cyclobacteriaceae bacterium]UYN85357.1 MAG: D-aminoacylase [Cyclobacteriaceae bacterium]